MEKAGNTYGDGLQHMLGRFVHGRPSGHVACLEEHGMSRAGDILLIVLTHAHHLTAMAKHVVTTTPDVGQRFE